MRRSRILAALLLGLSLLFPAAAAPFDPTPYFDRMKDAMAAGDFEAIEKLWREAENETELDLHGDAKLMHFLNSANLHKPANAPLGYYEEWARLTERWRRERPEHPLAVFLAADAQISLAWYWRGSDYASSVSAEGWKGFEEHIEAARKLLLSRPELLERSSLLYHPLLEVGKASSWTPELTLKVVTDGLRRNPKDLQLLFAALPALTPRWSGDARSVEALVQLGLAHTRELGLEYYARLYTAAARHHYQQSLFKDSQARWSPMRDGYRLLIQRHAGPRGPNRYAMMACMAKDEAAWAEAVAKLNETGQQLDPYWWSIGGRRMLEGCQRWAGRS